MLGWAALLFAVYMIGFVIFHLKDINEYDYDKDKSYIGESCYDPSYDFRNDYLYWEKRYYDEICWRLSLETTEPQISYYTPDENDKGYHSREYYFKKAQDVLPKLKKKYEVEKQKIEKKKKLKSLFSKEEKEKIANDYLSNYDTTDLIGYVKRTTANDILDWNENVNYNRKYAFKEDLKKNALYAAIISILIMVLGRYIIKSAKWVNKNKTE